MPRSHLLSFCFLLLLELIFEFFKSGFGNISVNVLKGKESEIHFFRVGIGPLGYQGLSPPNSSLRVICLNHLLSISAFSRISLHTEIASARERSWAGIAGGIGASRKNRLTKAKMSNLVFRGESPQTRSMFTKWPRVPGKTALSYLVKHIIWKLLLDILIGFFKHSPATPSGKPTHDDRASLLPPPFVQIYLLISRSGCGFNSFFSCHALFHPTAHGVAELLAERESFDSRASTLAVNS